jgi:delta-aminolevulinic acid dehydratase/porphobilinogen synthase
MRETRLTAMIYPAGVCHRRQNRSEPVLGMPGISRVTPDLLLKQAEKLPKLANGHRFPVVPASKKDNKARSIQPQRPRAAHGWRAQEKIS